LFRFAPSLWLFGFFTKCQALKGNSVRVINSEAVPATVIPISRKRFQAFISTTIIGNEAGEKVDKSRESQETCHYRVISKLSGERLEKVYAGVITTINLFSILSRHALYSNHFQ
jgi:hypothetical protein